mgnify:CR=1 FL=1
MTQFVFLHVDMHGNLWKHIHFSYIKASQALKWWSNLKITAHCSSRVREELRNVELPCIIGRNLTAIIPIEE